MVTKILTQEAKITALEKIITDQDARLDKLEDFKKWLESQVND